MKNIVIYGAELPAFCAAFKAVGNATSDVHVTIIIPYPSTKLGGIATVGGLNYWDAFTWKKENQRCIEFSGKYASEFNKWNTGNNEFLKTIYPYVGTFDHLWRKRGYGYKNDINAPADDPDDLATYLDYRAATNDKISVLAKMDITDIEYDTDDNGKRTIKKLYLKSIYRASDGNVKWGRKTKVISGDYFVDASTDGKLTAALTDTTTGRYDWPEAYLDSCEKTSDNTEYVARQQSATLFFKIKDFYPGKKNANGIQETGRSLKLRNEENTNEYVDVDYYSGNLLENRKYSFENMDNPIHEYNLGSASEDDKMIKKYNITQNGAGSTEWWANILLLFDVDGRAFYRDRLTKFFPRQMLDTAKTTDEAWIAAKKEIGSKRFQNSICGFDGLSQAKIIEDANGEPIVGEVLYIRETRHMTNSSTGIAHNTENSKYAVTRDATVYAGDIEFEVDDEKSAGDIENYSDRIGLGFYDADIHPYKKMDLYVPDTSKDSKYGYNLARSSYSILRPDVFGPINGENFLKIENPVYIPYRAIKSSDVKNLLVPGYAASICSFSWGELRVMPCLCVLGDAAGVVLAHCVDNNIDDVNNVTVNKTFRDKYKYLTNNANLRFNKTIINTRE